ncbi:phage portal protein [Sphingomonas desiccabilis]|uniref:Phage portal protein n=1 Tax=Sphingomonas desiccabilis TaxID=429134 RepID=A0A4Q2IST1_9SPHN|nr:phage portal protein [Sphingomonas desiccabilis]MBB3911896.1 HK97 family phage portal protein [Sphingomonas desiccabilis]RXZ31398.1 phage portal protein [Sphingomonas desiccabilis]
MKWFGRKSLGAHGTAGEGRRPALSPGGSIAALGSWPTSYEAQVRAGYLENAIAQRAVRMVAEGVAAAPVTGADPEMVRLVCRRSAGQVLVETIAAQLLLHGNAFVQLLDDGRGGVGELYALRPERVTVEPDANGWPVAFRYRVGAEVQRLAAEDPRGRAAVVHIKAFHPLDDHYGLGCLGAAAGAIAVHNAAARWNKALLDNAARPSGALVYDPGDGGVLSRDQFDRLRAEMEAGFAGAANAGRPMLLEGGLKWQAMSLTPADMDFNGLKAQAAREIALAFGVPPMLLGLPGDNTYANYREANRALWRLSILPLAERILAELSQGLGGHFADPALSVDLDRVPALAEDRERLWGQVSGAEFLTREEKRAMVGVGPVVGAGL